MTTTWISGDTNPLTLTVTEGGVAVSSLATATITGEILNSAGTAVVTLADDDFTKAANVATAYPDTSGLDGVYTIELQIVDAAGATQTGIADLYVIGDAIA